MSQKHIWSRWICKNPILAKKEGVHPKPENMASGLRYKEVWGSLFWFNRKTEMCNPKSRNPYGNRFCSCSMFSQCSRGRGAKYRVFNPSIGVHRMENAHLRHCWFIPGRLMSRIRCSVVGGEGVFPGNEFFHTNDGKWKVSRSRKVGDWPARRVWEILSSVAVHAWHTTVDLKQTVQIHSESDAHSSGNAFSTDSAAKSQSSPGFGTWNSFYNVVSRN